MDHFKRNVFILLLIFFTSYVQADPINDENPGIAFIHGTRDHRLDAYGDYWKTDYIQSVASGLKNSDNFYVVHCDYSQYMWDEEAAGCTASQLRQFIITKNISSLTIYSHSDGGNVIRWIVSNPTYNKDYLLVKQKVKQIIAIAPSSGGTPLADEVLDGGLFEGSVAWLLGYNSDAVKQQRVGDMLIFNDELLLGSKGRPSLALPFRVVVGTDVTASPFTSLSYCNGYLQNSGLKLTKMFLENCADGFLNCHSQLAAGELWFYDVDKTENNTPLSHNQTRHSCGNLDKVLITALGTKGVK